MLDNGLLKYYKTIGDMRGRLRVNKIPNLSTLAKRFGVRKYEIEGKEYFCKDREKSMVEAEVLISQLYPQLGIPSAIYIPANRTYNDNESVISNSVRSENNNSGVYFLKHLLALEEGRNRRIHKFFTSDCVKQIATMQALDLATANCDRHEGNFFIQTEDPFGKGKAEGITTIDYGASGAGIDHGHSLRYYNYFNREGATYIHSSWQDVIEDLKSKKAVLSVVRPQELAETVGKGIDLIPKTAQDIKETIGYEVSPNYVEALQRSFEEVAEELER